jgi:alkane 1-monooxygenase
VWIVYGAVPFLDLYLPLDKSNPTKEEAKLMEKDFRFRVPLYVITLCELYCFYSTINYLVKANLSWSQNLGIILTGGHFIATSVVVGHEFFHKREFWDKVVGCIMLGHTCYFQWYTAHLYGHHKRWATKDDPVTAFYGESFYSFMFKSHFGGLRHAWELEGQRVKTIHGASSAWTWKNKMIWFTLGNYVLVPYLMYHFFGFKGYLFFAAQVAVGLFYVEMTNYLEHYGLMRKEVNGEYERTDVTFSWNAPQAISNFVLFKLQRHADHHESVYKPYQLLLSYDESPQLPAGYTVMAPIAWIPPLFFSIMHPRIDEYKKNKKVGKEIEYANFSRIRNVSIVFAVIATALMYVHL